MWGGKKVHMCAQVKLLREALGTEGESLAQNVQQVCDLLELQEDGQAPTQDQVNMLSACRLGTLLCAYTTWCSSPF